MNKVIVLHDRYTSEPIVIRTSAIKAIRKAFDRPKDITEEYSEVLIQAFFVDVKETIGTVMTKIKKAESEDEDTDSKDSSK